MRKMLLGSVAAVALIATTGFVVAQGTGTSAPPAGTTSPPASSTTSPSGSSAQTTTPSTPSSGTTAQDKAGSTTQPAAKSTAAPTDSKSAPTADTKAGATDQKTTGNAPTGAAAAPPPEKRSQITSVIKQEKVQEVTNVNFNISIGATVPSTVRYYPLPARVVEIYPEWRGYDFIYVRGRYIILRPKTHEIVYIIEG